MQLRVEDGLKIWADTRKTPIMVTGTHVGMATVYEWTIATDGAVTFPNTLHVEGTELGNHKIFWDLLDAAGNIKAGDIVDINVEKIVWPNQDPSAQWDPEKETTEWKGFELPEGWFISKSLTEIIVAKRASGTNFGYIRTEYPKETASGRWEGTPDQNSNAVLDLNKLAGIPTGGWDGSTIRIEVAYVYEQSPNITTGDFVDTNLQNRWQASFFHNSGIKIENRSEIQIFDTQSLLDAIDGSQETLDGAVVNIVGDANEINAGIQNPTTKVKLDHGGLAWTTTEADQINSLISGIPYAHGALDYNPGETNMQRLDRAPKGGQTMIIDVFRETDDEYTFVVTIDGHTKTNPNIIRAGMTDPGKLYLQSHWGSGVKFTSAKVKKL